MAPFGCCEVGIAAVGRRNDCIGFRQECEAAKRNEYERESTFSFHNGDDIRDLSSPLSIPKIVREGGSQI